MEIDITDFARKAELCELSASAAELGRNACQITWNNAKREAQSIQFIDADSRDEFEAWIYEFGAWDRDEITAWSLEECNAILIQFIAGDLRELEALCPSDIDEFSINWRKAEKLAERGTVGGRLARDNTRLYFYMGN